MIHLESNFVQFKEELLPKEGNKALLTFPFLHIYWTECCVSIHLKGKVTRTCLGMGLRFRGLGFAKTAILFEIYFLILIFW